MFEINYEEMRNAYQTMYRQQHTARMRESMAKQGELLQAIEQAIELPRNQIAEMERTEIENAENRRKDRSRKRSVHKTKVKTKMAIRYLIH